MTEPEPGRGGRRTRPLRAADRPLKAQGRPAARRTAEAAPPPPPRARVHAETELVFLGVSVRFGGLSAVDEVDLEVRAGEIVGLIGPNGAGKTTLMECVSGFQPVTAGGIAYRGLDLLGHPPGRRAGLGIGRTLQNVRLFPYLTVLDNLRVALHRH